MCFITKKSKRLKVATEDMIVYKFLEIKEGRVQSPSQEYIYIPNKIEETTIKISDHMSCFDDDDEEQLVKDYGWNWRGNEKLIAYGEGFHFFTNRQDAEIRMRRWRGTFELREFIVPKGARYMTDRGLGICNKIMMK